MKPLMVFYGMTTNDLLIEEAPTGKTSCKQCHKDIPKASIRVTFRRYYSKSHYFHLNCFTPILKVRIYFDGVSQMKDPERKQEVEGWIENWNRQFDLCTELLEIYMRKRVMSVPPPNRRVLLESFKYLDVRTLVAVGSICKAWLHVSWEDEIWDMHVSGILGGGTIKGSGRAAYILAYFTLCIHCKKPLQSNERHMICPLTNRPKCLRCFKNHIYRPLTLDWVKQSDGISARSIKELNIPTFDFHNRKCIYLYMLEGKLGHHRKQRVLQLIQKCNPDLARYFTPATCEFLQNLDEKCYEQRVQVWTNCTDELRYNCGAVLDIVMNDKSFKKWMKS